ncbi:PAS domain-containing protein [Natrarchaeobius chitinivorans]|uniref:PAS domain S-box protein n=1 Tax=Natrarchaeobius chitinivorans TaxID=1679083 RepID=A0A3N6LUV5_NATCH|nr:PAS domain S-box protein [Natrarchaeobius chitinivorans]
MLISVADHYCVDERPSTIRRRFRLGPRRRRGRARGIRALVDAVGDGTYQLDARGRFVGVDETILETTGYDRDDLLGEHVSVALDDASVERIERGFRRRLEAGDHDDPVQAHEIIVETPTATSSPVTCGSRCSSPTGPSAVWTSR